MHDEYHAKAGDEGYFVLPQSRSDEDGMLVYFNEKENMWSGGRARWVCPSKYLEIADKRIPLWSLIYHGIVLSNPYVSTINVPIKGKRSVLELMERGGRPSLYFNSKFVNSDNDIGMEDWMGSVDFYNSTKEQIEYSAEKSAEFYHEYKKYAYLQSKMIKNHEETEKNVFVTTYENGDKIKCDYNNLTYELIKAQ